MNFCAFFRAKVSISEQILIGWVISLLTGKKPILTDSVEKYLSAIGYDWLWYTLGEDLLSWEEEDFEAVYEQLIDFKRNEVGIQAINYPAGRLQQLHDFAHEHFGIVKVSVPDTKIERKVRAEWVSPARYQAMLEQLKTYVEPLEAEMVMVLYILAIRTGMRKLELLGVTYQDIENLSSGKPSIIVRPNHHRRLKTDVSMRRIPLYALLTPHELTFVTSYLQANKSHNKQQLMLTLSTTNERLESYSPNRLMNEVLQDIDNASGVTNYHFHGFRHTAFSNISLILTADKQLASVLTGFSEAQIDTIRTTLLGDNPVTQLGWNMVAALAGHISPQRNIEYYNHFLVLAATYELTKAELVVPLTLIKNIANISTQNLIDNKVKVTQLADLSANTSQKTIRLLDLRALLYRRSLDQKHSRSPKDFSFDIKPLQAILGETVETSDELFGYYSTNQLIALLGYFDNQVGEKDLAKLTKVTPADRKLLRQRAHAIANIESSRKESRFSKQTGKLSPILIDLVAERRMLRQIMKRAAYFRQTHPEEWQWFIHLITNKITINHASISFKKTVQSLLELEKFLLMADKIFTLDWCMYASDEPLFDSFDKARITYLQTMQKKPQSKQKRHANQPAYYFEGLEKFLFDKNLTYKIDKKLTTIHIGIKVKDTQLGKFKYKFSSLLRFFVHLVLLQDDRHFKLL